MSIVPIKVTHSTLFPFEGEYFGTILKLIPVDYWRGFIEDHTDQEEPDTRIKKMVRAKTPLGRILSYGRKRVAQYEADKTKKFKFIHNGKTSTKVPINFTIPLGYERGRLPTKDSGNHIWITNGKQNKKIKSNDTIPKNWRKGFYCI